MTRQRKPTKEQKEALQRLSRRDGWTNLTKEDAAILAEHPQLTVSQRKEMAAKAAA